MMHGKHHNYPKSSTGQNAAPYGMADTAMSEKRSEVYRGTKRMPRRIQARGEKRGR